MNKTSLFLISFIFFGFSLSLSAQEVDSAYHFDIKIDSTTRTLPEFYGFGVEWDSRGYLPNNVTDKDFDIIKKRLDWMKIPIVRIMMLTSWCYNDSGEFNWNSKEMKQLYRILNYCREKNIDVILCEWGIEPEWLNVAGLKKADDPKYAKSISKYLYYLINEKKYSCIKYFEFVNEPNFEVKNFNRWENGVKNIYQELKSSGLLSKIKFIGPGTSADDDWYFNSVQYLNEIFTDYDVHSYETIENVKRSYIQIYVRNLRSFMRKNDPFGKSKKFFITEAGMRDGQSAEINTNIDSCYYGLFMADYAIQAVRGGASAVLAWMLDDNSHVGFQWGMWKNSKANLQLRPWFFTWSLMTKLFPKGAVNYKVKLRSINLRILAAKIPKKLSCDDKENWSYSIVNLENVPIQVNLSNKKTSNRIFYKYVYSKENINVDSGGFPKPVGITNFIQNKVNKIVCPPKSVTFFTTLK